MIRIYRRSLIAASLAVALSLCRTPGACPEAGPGQMTAPSDALQMVESVKEPKSALAQIIRDAAERLQGCPADEASWYELIRAAELRTEISSAWQFPAQNVAGSKLISLAEATAEAARRVPHSPRIALVDSRVRPEPARVAALVARFPGFAPLRLSLAQAQLKAGQVDLAAKSLDALQDLKAIPGGIETLAAIRLAQGNPKAALAALAAKDTGSMMTREAGSEAYERTSRIPRERAEVSFQAQMALHRPVAALRPLLDAAALNSEEAQALLKRPDSALAKAIAAARQSGKLSAIDKSYLKE